MKFLIRKCSDCGRYTLNQENCPVCHGRVISPHPPKFSMEDPYWKYRIDKEALERLSKAERA